MFLEGLFVCGRVDEAIPLKSLSVRAFLQGYVVGFRSRLTYENNTSNPVEVFFRTPIDDSHAVVGLEACIDGRKIRAKIEEKEKARERYKEAISKGHTAAFGEEKKGDIFSLVLGYLPRGEKAVLQLTMVGELAVEPDGAVRFVLPTVLKPRYTPPGSANPLAPVTPTGSGPVHHATGTPDYKFEMVINGAPGIAEVTSPSHEISVENTGQNINVSLLADDKQADIIILVRPKDAHKPLVIVEPGLSNGENDFEKSAVVMVSFFPEFKGDSSCPQAACEFVFVVDRSGSMDGSYIRDAAQTLLLFLKSIPEGCYFNVIGFGSSYEKLFPESVPYNQANLGKAEEHAENLAANLGGTELLEPLKYIFSYAPMKGLPKQVFVLTDGGVSNTESVIQLVAKNSHNSRCFTFGIGSGASSTLAKGIAEAGKGASEFITTGERMQAKVIRSLKKAMQPVVTNPQVSYTVSGYVTVNPTLKNSLPAIFIGDRLIVYGIILHQNSMSANIQEGSICLTGDLLGSKVEHNMKFQVPFAVTKENMLQVSIIHHLASKRLIKEMEAALGSSRARRNPEIIKLSCDSNVISSQTAFIAIDEERKEAVKGSLQSWDVRREEFYDFDARMTSKSQHVNASCGMHTVFLEDSESDPEPDYDMGIDLSQYHLLSLHAAFREPGIEKASVAPLLKSKVKRRKHRRRGKHRRPRVEKLSRIINLQLASGEWRLTSDLAKVMEKTVAEIKSAIPVACDGNLKIIWATIIVLTYLQLRQSQLKDEWELVAAKAWTWLTKQELPKECPIQVLCQKASAFLC